MSKKNIKVGITQGDINGIGYEVIMKTLQDTRIMEICTPIVYGSSKVAGYHKKALELDTFNFNQASSIDNILPKKANIISVIKDDIKVELGKSTEVAGNAAYQALEAAVSDLKAGKIDVLVTAPINKTNIQSSDFNFPGHTEYLQQCFDCDEVLMFMVSDLLRVGVVTGHVPLKLVADEITKENILSKMELMNESLKKDFGIRKPKIAVLGLNPHAGDNGLLGTEEADIIIPAIEEANEKNIMAIGPFAADGFFGSNAFKKFDAILAMYHDQGLAPFKSIAFDNGINYTAGLPIVRTSPSHGTAYELAGENTASEDSFRSALFLAVDVFRNRNNMKELTENPLPSVDVSEINKN